MWKMKAGLIGFLLTRPLRDVTQGASQVACEVGISTHTPLAGRDGTNDLSIRLPIISTHTPLAGRDSASVSVVPCMLISTHTPLAGRDEVYGPGGEYRFSISTHTPLAGRDYYIDSVWTSKQNFYSHAPCGT